MKLVPESLNEVKFERGQDPKRALGIGTFPSLIEEYEFLISKYPELDISNSYKVQGFVYLKIEKWLKISRRDTKP